MIHLNLISQLNTLGINKNKHSNPIKTEHSDSVEISSENKKQARIISNMLKQREQIVNTVCDELTLEQQLYHYKEYFIENNREIRYNLRSIVETGKPLENFNEKENVKLDNLIKQSKIPEDITLYRGGTLDDLGLTFISQKDFFDKYFKVGDIYSSPKYIETSLDKKIGERFAKNNILFVINVPKNTNGLYMENIGIEEAQKFEDEKEILLPRNLLYQIKKLTKTENCYVVEVDVLKKAPFNKKVHEYWKECKIEK